MLLLVTLLFSAALAGNYSVFLAYTSTTDCSGALSAISADPVDPTNGCFPINCTCDSTGCVEHQCYVTTLPEAPNAAIVFNTYSTSNDCSGEPETVREQANTLCLPSNAQRSTFTTFTCSGGSFTQATYNNNQCSGTPQSSNTFPLSGSGCISGGPNPTDGSIFYVCGAKCFHKDTKITYEGKEMTFKDIKASPVCSIPHVIKANGRKITTTCEHSLRVTDEHLVMTPEGFKTAGSLKKGDKLYKGIHVTEATCEITKIETERAQEYFGLNCPESHVEADGYWVSTFGINHAIPALWMKLASKVVGIEAASSIGNSIAQMLNRFGLL